MLGHHTDGRAVADKDDIVVVGKLACNALQHRLVARQHILQGLAAFHAGVLLAIAAGAAWGVTTVVARRTTSIPPLKMQGLLALGAFPVMAFGSAMFEHGQWQAIQRATPMVWASLLWAGVVSSVGAPDARRPRGDGREGDGAAGFHHQAELARGPALGVADLGLADGDAGRAPCLVRLADAAIEKAHDEREHHRGRAAGRGHAAREHWRETDTRAG